MGIHVESSNPNDKINIVTLKRTQSVPCSRIPVAQAKMLSTEPSPRSVPSQTTTSPSGEEFTLDIDLAAVADPSQSFNLQEFLTKFKETVTTGIEFMKQKITDPTDGFDMRVKFLEDQVLSRNTGVLDMVADLRDMVNDPEEGVVAWVEHLESETPWLQ